MALTIRSDFQLARELLLRDAKETIGGYLLEAQKSWKEMIENYRSANPPLEPNVAVVAVQSKEFSAQACSVPFLHKSIRDLDAGGQERLRKRLSASLAFNDLSVIMKAVGGLFPSRWNAQSARRKIPIQHMSAENVTAGFVSQPRRRLSTRAELRKTGLFKEVPGYPHLLMLHKP